MFEETAKLLEILHTGYIICFVLTIMFFLISVLLFFVFDIRRVFMIRTGRAAKRDIRKLEEENFKTGRLSQYHAASSNNRKYYTTSSLGSQELPKTEQINMNPAQPPIQQAAMQPPSMMQMQGDEMNTALLGQSDTTVLNGEMTTVLNAGATTVLSQGMQGNTLHHNRTFRIVKNEMHIHTEEII